jgi:fibronectin-binding autotransporter adhesin
VDGTSVDVGATLQIEGNNLTIPEPVVLAVPVNGLAGTTVLENVSGNNTWDNDITLQGDATVKVDAGSLKATHTVDTGNSILTVDTAAAATFTQSDFGIISGTGRIRKTNSGTLLLTLANTYSGGTTVEAGTLLVNGSQTHSPVTVNGGTLGGTGMVGSVTVNAGGTISPGSKNAPGTLSTAGDVVFATGSSFSVLLDNPGDLLKVGGAVTLKDPMLKVSLGPGFAPTFPYVILTSTGITGHFIDPKTSQELLDGSTFQVGSTVFTINYVTAGTGLVTLTVGNTRTHVWTGNGPDDFWSDAANWKGGVPQSGDDLEFPAGAQQTSNQNDLGPTTFGTISFTGAGYDIFGSNTISLTQGIDVAAVAGDDTFGIFLTLAGDQTFRVAAGATLHLEGVIMGGHMLTIDAEGDVSLFHLNGVGGGFTKTGPGDLTFLGNSDILYNGPTTVEAGTLDLSLVGTTAINGPLVLGKGPSIAQVRLNGPDEIGASAAVTVGPAGLLNLNGFPDTIGALTVTGGVVLTHGGILTLNGIRGTALTMIGGTISTISGQPNPLIPGALILNGDVMASSYTPTPGTTNPAVIDGILSLGGAARTFGVFAPSPSVDGLDVFATVIGDSGSSLIKAGPGTMDLMAACTYRRGTIVNDGQLIVKDDTTVKSTGGFTVNPCSTLTLAITNPQLSEAVVGPEIILNGGTLSFVGLPGEATPESFGELALKSGSSVVESTVSTDPGSSASMTFASLSASAGATVAFVGVGVPLGTPANKIVFVVPPQLQNGFLPYAGVASGSGGPLFFATYGLEGIAATTISADPADITGQTAFGHNGGSFDHLTSRFVQTATVTNTGTTTFNGPVSLVFNLPAGVELLGATLNGGSGLSLSVQTTRDCRYYIDFEDATGLFTPGQTDTLFLEFNRIPGSYSVQVLAGPGLR